MEMYKESFSVRGQPRPVIPLKKIDGNPSDRTIEDQRTTREDFCTGGLISISVYKHLCAAHTMLIH